jgi:hypothetical protein
MIRNLQITDLEQLQDIHKKHYINEFAFPNFQNNFMSLFTVIDREGQIISAGGVRAIAESVIITDLDATPRQRRKALLEILQASVVSCRSNGFDQLHAFVKGKNWEKVLNKYEFKPCSGTALYRNT